MPTTVLGTKLRVRFGTTSTTAAIYGATSCSFTVETEMTSITHKDNAEAGYPEYEPASNDWTVETEGLMYVEAAVEGWDVLDPQLDFQRVFVDFTDAVTGRVKWSGSGFISSSSFSGAVKEIATYKVTIKGSSLLVKSTVA